MTIILSVSEKDIKPVEGNIMKDNDCVVICFLYNVMNCFFFAPPSTMQTVDNDLALKIYIKARATPKVVAAFAERREFDKILIYSKQVNLITFSFFVTLATRIVQDIFCQIGFSTSNSFQVLLYYFLSLYICISTC